MGAVFIPFSDLLISELADERLIAALKDKNSRARWQAAWVLGSTKTEKAVEPLIEALADADWMVRDEAAWILSQIKSNRVAKKESIPGKASEIMHPDRIYCGQRIYPCYPAMLDTKPDILSPHTTLDGIEVVTALMKH